MSTTPDPLVQAKYAENTQTTQYPSTGMRTIIDKFQAYNSDTVVQTLTVNIVASAGAAAATNVLVVKSLAAGEAYIFPEIVGNILGPGDFISTLASAASKVVIRSSGRKLT